MYTDPDPGLRKKMQITCQRIMFHAYPLGKHPAFPSSALTQNGRILSYQTPTYFGTKPAQLYKKLLQ